MLDLKTKAFFFIAVVAPMAILAGCGASSDTSSESTSSLLLNLTIAEGVDIDEVLWTVSGGDMEDMMGTIDTSAPESTASVELFGVPEGLGYLVKSEALSALGDFFCSGSASFDVAAGVATPVDVTLSCQRECNVLICREQEGECERINLPDGTSCADGAGSCVGGSCEILGI
ncbi:MAG: hypothetical protein WBM75_00035 [Polyangiales bacterium]